MNLALTYASRTQHVRLARHISELIQLKSMEELSDDEYESPIGNNWTNQNAHDVTDDVTYAKSRSHSLNKKPNLISKASGKKITLSGKTSTEDRSKFNRYMDQVKRGKFLSSTSGNNHTSRTSRDDRVYDDEGEGRDDDENSLDVNYDQEGVTGNVRGEGYDETKELFSDSEQDVAGDVGDGGDVGKGDEGEGGGGGGGSDDGMEDDFSFTPTRDVGGYSSSSGKRANPFKVSMCVHLALSTPVVVPMKHHL